MWRINSKKIKNDLIWEKIWENENFGLLLEKVSDRPIHRFSTGRGKNAEAGAVCICEFKNKIVFVKQTRIAPEAVLLELPRGGYDKSDKNIKQTALRELKEETGFLGKDERLIGYIYPDSGVIATKVAVVLAKSTEKMSKIDNEADKILLIDNEKISKYIANAKIRDGITLSALMLYKTYMKFK